MKKSEAHWEKEAKKIKDKLKVDQPFGDEDIMAFGAHKGKPLKEVPAEYLVWLYTESDLAQKVRLFKYIDQDFPLILGQASEERSKKRDWEGK
jgi:uncharacterized protein (DUF3820 family)